MNKKMHFKMLALGLFGLFLTFRREIHDYARIEDQNDKEEEELRALNIKYESKHVLR